MYSFKLSNIPSKLNLKAGKYNIYVAGGHFIRTESDFKVNLFNEASSMPIELTKTLKIRTFRKNKKAIRLYSFNLKTDSSLEISIESIENLTIKENMLAETPSIFKLMNKFIFPNKYRQKEISEIDLVIELS